MYQLGWLTRVDEFSSSPSGSYILVGHTNFGGGLQAIRLLGTHVSSDLLQDTYIWFNDLTPANADSLEGRNQVIVNTRPSGVMGAEKTQLVAVLGVGQTYNDVRTYYSFQVLDIGNGMATISFGPGPTLAPVTVAPTPQPVAPTPQPVAPTPAPVITCPNTNRASLCPSPCQFLSRVCFAPGNFPCSRITRRNMCPTVYCRFQNGTCQPLSTLICPDTNNASLCPSPCQFANRVCFAPGNYPCARETRRVKCPTAFCRFTNRQCLNI